MRNQFNLSREMKTSCDMGQLIPVMCEEVLPGDTFIHRSTALTRVAPMQHPVMHRVELRMHSFYVPNRILWDGWEDFITGKNDVDPQPTVTLTGNETSEKLVDYLGVPLKAGLELLAYPIQAYNLIYNEFFRDQDLMTEVDLLNMNVQNCAWQKDYFTIARPQPQQGDPVGIPVGSGSIPVRDLFRGDVLADHGSTGTATTWAGTQAPTASMSAILGAGTGGGANGAFPSVNFADGEAFINIDDFRRSMALQRFAEARMRFGSRYVDYLRYIGVNPSDGRLDRPEYLGGGKETLAFSEVLSTATVPEHGVGEMFGHGIGMGRNNGYRKMFEEHGWVLTLLSARPKTVYQDAVPRKFTRKDAMDYWQKELEVLPWQEITEQEVHADGDPNSIFGYVPRYEEYRHGVSSVSGTLRGGTENDWHMGREFASPPTLNGSFVKCTPTDRIYQDANMPDLIINVMHDIQAKRFVGQTATMGQDI